MSSTEIMELVWRLIIAVAPIIVSAVFAILQSVFEKMSDHNQRTIKDWIGRFVSAAQMLEPDPIKRKEWVVAQITKMFPRLDPVKISALIESILVEKKMWDDEAKVWDSLPPTESRLP
jgi:hypothetical protein